MGGAGGRKGATCLPLCNSISFLTLDCGKKEERREEGLPSFPSSTASEPSHRRVCGMQLKTSTYSWGSSALPLCIILIPYYLFILPNFYSGYCFSGRREKRQAQAGRDFGTLPLFPSTYYSGGGGGGGGLLLYSSFYTPIIFIINMSLPHYSI